MPSLQDEMTAFLAARPEQKPADPPAEAESATEPEPKPSPEPKPAEEDDDTPEQIDGRVPLAALEGERAKRRDWKEKAIRAETERDAERATLAELRRQLEEAKKAPPPQHAAQQPQQQQGPRNLDEALLNERLNNSEDRLRDKLGDEAVDALIAELPALRDQDPSLVARAFAQRHPYGWLHGEVAKRKAMAEVGADPAAYRAKIEAELRAKWEAERASAAPAPSPKPIPATPSIAGARSVGARSVAWTGDRSLDDIFDRRPSGRA